MPMQVLSYKATERLMQLARDKTEPPLKIIDHKRRIDESIKQVEQNAKDSGVIDYETVNNISKMQLELDTLYANWAEGIERIRWIDIPAKTDITVEQILRECVYSTESITCDMGVEVLAEFLDTNGLQGILKKLAGQYLVEIRPLLDEVMSLDEETLKVLEDSKGFFGISDADEAREKVIQRFMLCVNQDSPRHVIRAMIAHIEFSVGSYTESLAQAGFARNEKDVENFGAKFHTSKNPEVETSMLAVETRLAEIFIELLAEARQS